MAPASLEFAFSTTLGLITDLSRGCRKRLQDYQMPTISQPSKRFSVYAEVKDFKKYDRDRD